MLELLKRWIKKFPFLDSEIQYWRRKILSKTLGYPNWPKIFGASPIPRSPKANTKVLIATSIGCHLPAMQMETVLAVALAYRGADVHSLLCDSTLSSCQMCEPRFFPSKQHFIENGPKKFLCGHCFTPAKQQYENIGAKTHAFSETLDQEEHDFAANVSQNIALDEIEKYQHKGIKIGEHAKAGALRYLARSTLDDEPKADAVLRKYFHSALITAIAVNNLFSTEKFDVAVFHHGIYVPQGIIGEVARKMGVRVVTWNPAYRKSCFIFSHRDTYHHTLMDEPVTVWNNLPWSKARETKLDVYLHSRWHGENDWIRFHENPYFEKNKIVEEIGFDPNKPLIGCLTNVLWDAQLHYPDNAFDNMLEWLFSTIDYFIERIDLQLVIRVHPAEIRGAVPTRQPVVKEIHKRYRTLPKNVFIVPPESNASTYSISELCDTVIIYGTKTGVELTSAGIPVIVAGEAWIRGKGLTTDVQSRQHYTDCLDALPNNLRSSNSQVIQAKKYAYHFFFRRMIPINLFSTGPGWPSFVFSGNLGDLYNQEDKGLECVCNGIINGTPFIYDEAHSE